MFSLSYIIEKIIKIDLRFSNNTEKIKILFGHKHYFLII